MLEVCEIIYHQLEVTCMIILYVMHVDKEYFILMFDKQTSLKTYINYMYMAVLHVHVCK